MKIKKNELKSLLANLKESNKELYEKVKSCVTQSDMISIPMDESTIDVNIIDPNNENSPYTYETNYAPQVEEYETTSPEGVENCEYVICDEDGCEDDVCDCNESCEECTCDDECEIELCLPKNTKEFHIVLNKKSGK